MEFLAGEPVADGSINSFFIPSVAAVVSTDAAFPRTNAVKEVTNQSTGIFEWGDDNLEPQNIIKTLNEHDLLRPAIEKKAKLVYGQGFVYGPERIVDTPHGKERIIEPAIIPEIEDWSEDTNLKLYARESSTDRFSFGNFFPEMILGKYNNHVHKLYNLDASECRLALQDKRTGAINKVHISANWDSMGGGNNNVIKVDALDPYGSLVKQILARPDIKKWVLPMRSQSHGDKYYAKDSLYGLRQSGWLDVAKSVPKWKKAVMENQLSIKFHIQVSAEWWEWKYPGFKEKPLKEKHKLQQAEITRFLDAMKGTDKAGNVLMTSFQYDPRHNKEWAGWKIEPLDNSKFDSNENHLEYASEADLRTIRALNMHPTLFGAARGKGSAGSGSDLRVAENQAVLECKPEQDDILAPILAATRLNGWHEKYGGEFKRLGWQFKSYFIARLDSGKELSDKAEGNTNNSDES